MTKLKFYTGDGAKLPSSLEKGAFYLVEDEQKLFINDCIFDGSSDIPNQVKKL